VISRETNAAERGVGRRAIGRLVPVDHARPDIGPEAVVQFWVLGQHACRQTEARAVGLVDRRVEILDPDQLQHRTEQLLIEPVLGTGHVDQRGGEIGPLLMRPLEPADRLATLHHQGDEPVLEDVRSDQVDHRPHERLRVGHGMVDDDPVDQLADLGHQLLMLAVLDDQPPRRRAALTGREVSRLDNDRRCRLHVRRIPHHDRIVAAQLQGQHFIRSLSELAVERHASTNRSGKKQAINSRLAG
jgi:hypothetical protein